MTTASTSVALSIEPDHPAFAGHFPSQPVVPGVVLLDHGLRALVLQRASNGSHASTRCRIASAKFLSPVGPGEPTRLVIEPTGRDDSYRLKIHAGTPDRERIALSSDVTFEPVAAPVS